MLDKGCAAPHFYLKITIVIKITMAEIAVLFARASGHMTGFAKAIAGALPTGEHHE